MKSSYAEAIIVLANGQEALDDHSTKLLLEMAEDGYLEMTGLDEEGYHCFEITAKGRVTWQWELDSFLRSNTANHNPETIAQAYHIPLARAQWMVV